jgi:hypothetical protein
MPHLAQPGGILQQMRMRYTAWRKLASLPDREGISLRKSAKHVQVSALFLMRWVERISLNNNPIKTMLKSKKKFASSRPTGPVEAT